MKFLKKTIQLFSLLVLIFATAKCYAAWPVLKVPQYEQILSITDFTDCANGFGKIPKGSTIKIEGSYVPDNWFWVYAGDGLCHPINNLIYFDYQPPGIAVYSGGTIKTFYGINKKTSFEFDFIVPQGNCPDGSCPWDCGPFYNHGNLPIKIGCAQDQR